MKRVIVKTKEELQEIINNSPSGADLNHLDGSLITDMSGLFRSSKFNGDISKWNVSNVTNMKKMFSYSFFNRDISEWIINCNNMEGKYIKEYQNEIFIRRKRHLMDIKMSRLIPQGILNNNETNW